MSTRTLALEALRAAIEVLQAEEDAASASVSPPTAAAVPEGWQLVPIEPSTEMWKAGLNWMWRDLDTLWAAMLKAAPTPPGEPT